MSVMKPGVSSSAPPKMTSAPSMTSRAGDAARGERAVEAQPRRAALRAHEQRAEDRVEDQQRDRRQDPDRLADLDDHVQLDDRDDDEEQDEQQQPWSAEGYASASARPRGARARRQAGAAPRARRSRRAGGAGPTYLDEHADVRLRAAQRQHAAGLAQAPRDHREVEHQRRVGERELGEVDIDVRGRASAPATSAWRRSDLRRAVLVPAAPQQSGVVVVGDDGAPTRSAGRTRLHISRMATLEEIEEALTNVIDPELGLDFVELGLIYGIEQDAGNVHVTFTLTTPGCPIGPQVTEQIEEFVGELEGVESVEIVDDVRAAVDARQDERGREVRARLLSPASSGPMPGPAAPRGERHDRCPDCGDADGHSMTADTSLERREAAEVGRSPGSSEVFAKPLRAETRRVACVRCGARSSLLLAAARPGTAGPAASAPAACSSRSTSPPARARTRAAARALAASAGARLAAPRSRRSASSPCGRRPARARALRPQPARAAGRRARRGRAPLAPCAAAQRPGAHRRRAGARHAAGHARAVVGPRAGPLRGVGRRRAATARPSPSSTPASTRATPSSPARSRDAIDHDGAPATRPRPTTRTATARTSPRWPAPPPTTASALAGAGPGLQAASSSRPT